MGESLEFFVVCETSDGFTVSAFTSLENAKNCRDGLINEERKVYLFTTSKGLIQEPLLMDKLGIEMERMMDWSRREAKFDTREGLDSSISVARMVYEFVLVTLGRETAEELWETALGKVEERKREEEADARKRRARKIETKPWELR